MATELLQIPITETANELTLDIDLVSSLGLVRLLRQSDAQLWSGYVDLPSVFDKDVITSIDKIAEACRDVLRSSDDSLIVMTGSGTSGRFAHFCARTFNQVLGSLGKPQCFRYLVSGGDKSIIISQELPEDDPHTSVRELKALESSTVSGQPAKRIVLFGITCGLSAPYAMGQINYAMRNPAYTTVLLGFNPVALARDAPVEGWDRTCRVVAKELSELASRSDRHFILNPAVGPEPVTGSTRMKGGSMTKVLLETIFTKAVSDAHYSAQSGPDCADTVSLLRRFESACRSAYLEAASIARVVDLTSASLRGDGHLYYVGAGAAGLLGFIDASEMLDTYGEDPHRVRGFIEGGWATVDNADGDLRSEGPLFHLSSDDFANEILPQLSSHDTVVFPCISTDSSRPLRHPLSALAARCVERGARTALVCVGEFASVDAADVPYDAVVAVRLEDSSRLQAPHPHVFAEFASKLVFNAISTGACVQKGRVFRNRMINMGISNNKLFFRAIGIVSQLIGVTQDAARRALLRAIHDVDTVTSDIEAMPVSRHLEIATPKELVLPTALLLATERFDVASARHALASEPVVRNIIKKHVK